MRPAYRVGSKRSGPGWWDGLWCRPQVLMMTVEPLGMVIPSMVHSGPKEEIC